MKIQDETIAQNAAAVSARISAIKELFEAIKQSLRAQVRQFPDVDAQSPRAMITKLNELQSAQVLLLKAEEAYYEKYARDDIQIAIDHDALRDQIGRALDRIRDTTSAGGIFAGVRSASD